MDADLLLSLLWGDVRNIAKDSTGRLQRRIAMLEEVLESGGGRSDAHKPGLVRTTDSVDSDIADAPLVKGSVDGRRGVGCVLGGKGEGSSSDYSCHVLKFNNWGCP